MLYNLVSSVLRLTFIDFEEENQFIIFAVDSLCDVIFLSDFAVKFRTGYLDDGILVSGNNVIWIQWVARQERTLVV